MEIETSLETIKKLSDKRETENVDFRSFLKLLDLAPEDLDAIVQKITGEVWAQIDCTQCANCCKKIRPVLDKADVSEFAYGLNTSISQFQEQYLLLDDKDPSSYIFNKLPCPFLLAKKCTNYYHRPEDCRSYPHLYKNDIVFKLWGVVENYKICPIVFNVYEQLKIELWNNKFIDDNDVEFDIP